MNLSQLPKSPHGSIKVKYGCPCTKKLHGHEMQHACAVVKILILNHWGNAWARIQTLCKFRWHTMLTYIATLCVACVALNQTIFVAVWAPECLPVIVVDLSATIAQLARNKLHVTTRGAYMSSALLLQVATLLQDDRDGGIMSLLVLDAYNKDQLLDRGWTIKLKSY